MKYDILLTSSVAEKPPYALKSETWDGRERLRESLCAIRLWLENENVASVTIIDVSGFEFPNDIFDTRRFQPIRCAFTQENIIKGMGYAETMGIDQALRKSRFVKNIFFKCSGRNYVSNFNEIVARQYDLRKGVHINSGTCLDGVDSRFYGTSKEYYFNVITPLAIQINDHAHRYIEDVYGKCLVDKESMIRIEYTGMSGHGGNCLDEYFSHELMEWAEVVASRIEIPEPLPIAGFGRNIAGTDNIS